MERIGGIGAQMIFVSALAAVAFTGLLWVMYACHHFMVVLTDSSGGEDEIRWPGESFLDFWWKPVFCLTILVVCLTFGGVLAAPFIVVGPLGCVVFLAVFLWFVYPFSIFCTLANQSWFAVFDASVYARLLRHSGATLLTALVTLPPVAVFAALLFGVVRNNLLWIVPAAAFFPLAVYFYARAWGRLAWYVLNAPQKKQREPRPLPKGAKVAVEDPWAEPPREDGVPVMDVEVAEDEAAPADDAPAGEDETEWSETFNPYGMMAEQKARESWQPPHPAHAGEPETGYAAGPPPEAPEAPAPKSLTEHYFDDLKKRHERMARVGAEDELTPKRKRRRPTFGLVFGSELFLFPFYPRTLVAWLNLSLATLVVLFFLRIAITFWPV